MGSYTASVGRPGGGAFVSRDILTELEYDLLLIDTLQTWRVG